MGFILYRLSQAFGSGLHLFVYLSSVSTNFVTVSFVKDLGFSTHSEGPEVIQRSRRGPPLP